MITSRKAYIGDKQITVYSGLRGDAIPVTASIDDRYMNLDEDITYIYTAQGWVEVVDGESAGDPSKENVSNKVISISASSTDTQYPSAKCVYDAINSIAGNPIEVSTDAGMSAVLTADNVGRAYLFTGTTGTYTNGDIYIVEENV